MPMPRLPDYRFLLLACCGALSGCSPQEYDQLMEQRLKEFRHTEKFQILFTAPIEFPGTPIRIRVPGITTDESQQFRLLTEKSRDPEFPASDPIRVSPYRLHPPFMRIPGLRATLEAPLTGNPQGDILPAYCYLAAVEKKQNKAEVPAAQIPKLIVESLKRAFPGQNPAWKDEQCDTPEVGKVITWKKVSVSGPQAWAYRGRAEDGLGEDTPHIHMHPGTFEVWLNDDHPDWLVLVAWRVAEPVKQTFDIEKFGSLTAGTLSIAAAEQSEANPQ